MQSVHITTEVVSSNPTHGKVYSMHHYVIMFVSDLRQVGGFLRTLWWRYIVQIMVINILLLASKHFLLTSQELVGAGMNCRALS
jgi:hypothetical protein